MEIKYQWPFVKVVNRHEEKKKKKRTKRILLNK